MGAYFMTNEIGGGQVVARLTYTTPLTHFEGGERFLRYELVPREFFLVYLERISVQPMPLPSYSGFTAFILPTHDYWCSQSASLCLTQGAVPRR